MKHLAPLFCALALATTFAAGGCKKSPLDRMKAVKDKVCKCKDMACAEKILEENSDLDGVQAKMSKEEQKKTFELSLEMAACMQKLKPVPGAE